MAKGIKLKNKRNQRALNFIKKLVKEKTGTDPAVTEAVLGTISDLAWDWRNGGFCLIGLDIVEVLKEMGTERCPENRVEDLYI